MTSSRGLPSTGCDKCRSRKIKCDETKPTCERCIKIGYNGCRYRDEFQRTWRNQTDKASEKAQEQWMKRSKRISPGIDQSPRPSAQGVPKAVLDRFYFDWSLKDRSYPKVAFTFLGYLPEMYKNAEAGSVLAEAGAAVAYANYCQRMGCSESRSKAIRCCNAALNLLKKAMSEPVDVPTEDMMLAIVLLGFYETLLNPELSETGSWTAHANGSAILMKMRLAKDAQSKIIVGLAGMIFSQEISKCLTRGDKPTLPIETMERIVVTTGAAGYELWELSYRSAELMSELNILLQLFSTDPELAVEPLHRVVEAVRALNNRHASWELRNSAQWSYERLPISPDAFPAWVQPLLQGNWTPQYVHVYSSLLVEAKLRSLWTSQLILNHALLHVLGLLGSAEASNVEPTLIDIIDRLCESNLGTVSAASGDPLSQSALETPSARGFLLLQCLPNQLLCLVQTQFTTIDPAGRLGRLQWLWELANVAQTQLGIMKAGAVLDDIVLEKMSIQLWRLHD